MDNSEFFCGKGMVLYQENRIIWRELLHIQRAASCREKVAFIERVPVYRECCIGGRDVGGVFRVVPRVLLQS